MFDFTAQELSQSLPGWGYPIMFVLMMLEGPMTTMIGAFLASLGIFNWSVVFALSVAGDVIGDILLYFFGYFGGRPVAIKFQKMLSVKKGMVEKLQQRFEKSGAKIIFSVKSTTGLSWITFIVAGAVRMPFAKFLLFSFLGGLVWSGFLVAFGYFFGFAAEQIDSYIKFAGWIIFGTAVCVLVYITIIKRKRLQKIFPNNNSNKKEIAASKDGNVWK